MISGLLKLMPRLNSTRYWTDLLVAYEPYSITGNDLASRRLRRARV
jgi:hypothetical protein